MYPKKLNLNYLHKTTIFGKHWIKIHDPKRNIITPWRIGSFLFLIFIVLYSVHQYSSEYTKASAPSTEIRSSPPMINQTLISPQLEPSLDKHLPVIPKLETISNNNIPHKTVQKAIPLEQIPHHPAPKPVTIDDQIVALLQQCEIHFKANRLTTGKGGTAYDCYNQVLLLQSNNAEAKQGKIKIEARYQQWVEQALKKGKLSGARKYIKRLAKINPNLPILAKLRQKTKKRQQQQQRQRTKTIQKSLPSKRRSTVTIPRASPSKPPQSAKAKKRSSSSKQRTAIPKKHKRSLPSRCINILSQESLGIRPLTSEQKTFKRKNCN